MKNKKSPDLNPILHNKILIKFWSQKNFADKLGIDAAVVSKVICGRIKLTEEDQKRWARLLGCKAESIFKK